MGYYARVCKTKNRSEVNIATVTLAALALQLITRKHQPGLKRNCKTWLPKAVLWTWKNRELVKLFSLSAQTRYPSTPTKGWRGTHSYGVTESSERLRSPWSGVHPWWWCPSTQHRQGGNMHQCYWGEQINDERSSSNHVTFSSHFPQSNGEAVKTIKSLRKKSTDLYLTLMAYPVASLVKGPQSSCWWGRHVFLSCHPSSTQDV